MSEKLKKVLDEMCGEMHNPNSNLLSDHLGSAFYNLRDCKKQLKRAKKALELNPLKDEKLSRKVGRNLDDMMDNMAQAKLKLLELEEIVEAD